MRRSIQLSTRIPRTMIGAILLGAVLTVPMTGFLRWSSAVGNFTGTRPGLWDVLAFLLPSRGPLRMTDTLNGSSQFIPVADASPDSFREPANPHLIAQLPDYVELARPVGGARTAWGDAAGAAAGLGGPDAVYAPDSYRLNVLLLGTAGSHREHGGLLTDAIILVSLDQRNLRIAAISIPRDLYVPLPAVGDRYKINAAYAMGERRFGDGLAYARETVAQVAGVPIHHAIRINMPAFAELVDTLGGVHVRVHRDFTGTEREGISVQRGLVRMDGDTALTYARSRKTSDDFDRSRRQREVLDAIRTRLMEVRNPFDMLGMLEIVGRHAESTLSAAQLRQLYELYANEGAGDVINLGFDISANGHLQAMRSPYGEYILVPRAGDFAALQEDVRGVFGQQGSGANADDAK